MKAKNLRGNQITEAIPGCNSPYCQNKIKHYYCFFKFNSAIIKSFCEECNEESKLTLSKMITRGWFKIKKKKYKKLQKRAKGFRAVQKIMNS